MRVSRLFNKDNDIPMHSSGYAEVACGKRMGSDNSQSFSQRQRLDKNRQIIKQYRESKIGSHERVHTEFSSGVKTESHVSSTPNTNQPVQTRQSARSAQLPRPVQGFREPGGRSYHPYS